MDLVFVSQEVDLFDLSVRDNLCLEKDIKEEKITNMIEKYLKDKTYVIMPSKILQIGWLMKSRNYKLTNIKHIPKKCENLQKFGMK